MVFRQYKKVKWDQKKVNSFVKLFQEFLMEISNRYSGFGNRKGVSEEVYGYRLGLFDLGFQKQNSIWVF